VPRTQKISFTVSGTPANKQDPLLLQLSDRFLWRDLGTQRIKGNEGMHLLQGLLVGYPQIKLPGRPSTSEIRFFKVDSTTSCGRYYPFDEPSVKFGGLVNRRVP